MNSFVFVAGLPVVILILLTVARWRRYLKTRPAPRVQFYLSDFVVITYLTGLTAWWANGFDLSYVEDRVVTTVIYAFLAFAGSITGKLWRLTTKNDTPLPSAMYLGVGAFGAVLTAFLTSGCVAIYLFLNGRWGCW